MKKLIIIGILIGFSLQVLNARDSYSRTFDSIYTAQKIYYSLDKDLNRYYKKLKYKLNRRGKRILANSEADWMERRNHRCAYPRTSSVNINCAIKKTRERLYFLQDRLRECQEIGCRNDRLY